MPQAIHPMLALPDHDEAARQNFVFSLRKLVVHHAKAGSREIYEGRVLPKFRRENGRAPKTRHEIRKSMLRDTYGQYVSALRLMTQELMWDSVGESVERQLPNLNANAKIQSKSGGTIQLDPKLKIPRYLTGVDIHGMPGSYQTDITEDDVYAGALYDRSAYIRGTGSTGGLNQDFGQSIGEYIIEKFPDLNPRRILDIGCSVGHSTLPYCDLFPDADIFAIDVAAPMLRYAHARAEALGKTVAFSQQNAEATDFPDGYFDLVLGHAILHETSTKAMDRILAEGHRLLAPGGICLHFEGPPWNRISLFDAATHDWDTHFNHEPFIGKMHEVDPVEMVTQAGFKKSKMIDTYVPSAFAKTGKVNFVGTTGSKAGGAYWVFGARK
jgi:ubiquinone/menaquinone biosynthesis C-methylase UbiE